MPPSEYHCEHGIYIRSTFPCRLCGRDPMMITHACCACNWSVQAESTSSTATRMFHQHWQACHADLVPSKPMWVTTHEEVTYGTRA